MTMTLKVRNTKMKPKIGMPRAIAYAHRIHDAGTDLEAMIECYGLRSVILFAEAIERRRNGLPVECFDVYPLIKS